MKNRIVLQIALLVLFLPILLEAQEKTKIKTGFSTLAIFQEPEKKLNGYVVEWKDSVIVFADAPKLTLPYDPKDVQTMAIPQVKTLKFRKRSSPAIGALVGFLAGTGIGALIASNSKANSGGDSWELMVNTAEDFVVDYAVVTLAGVGGAVAGTLIGTKRRAFKINGNYENYNAMRDKLERYSMKQ